MHKAADRIRNVALVGHRASGKTSLNEALLYQAGAINRMGIVAEGTTVSDSEPDERARRMSLSASLASFEWQQRRVNLIDTPGDPSFVADALGALRVCESAIFVVNAVMGVEIQTARLWQRAAELDLARCCGCAPSSAPNSSRRPARRPRRPGVGSPHPSALAHSQRQRTHFK